MCLVAIPVMLGEECLCSNGCFLAMHHEVRVTCVQSDVDVLLRMQATCDSMSVFG